MNKKTYAAILDDVVREHIPEDVDLAPRILARIQTRNGIAVQPRVKILMAAIAALLVLAFLLVQVPAVAEAMQRMLSRFIPGIGLVDVATTRILSEPLSVTREGITVTVEQVVADSQRTVVIYSVDSFPNQLVSNPNVVLFGTNNFPVERLPDNSEWPATSTCAGSEIPSRLRLPDGTEFSMLGMRGGARLLVGYGLRLVQFAPAIHEFASVPADVNELTFIIPCLEYPEGWKKLPRNWEIPLALVPAPPDMVTYPVIEVEIMSPVGQSPSTPDAGTPLATPTAPAAYNFSVTVDRVVPSDGGSGGGYRLYGTLDGGGDGLWLRYAWMHLFDANGQKLSGTGDYPYNNIPSEGLPFAFAAPAGYVPGQVTLVVDSVMADILLAADGGDAPSFTLDIGEHPQIDQVWELDRDFLIEGYPFHVATARFVERNGEYGLDFQMSTSDPAVNGVTLLNFDGPMGRNGGGFWGHGGEPFNHVVTYEKGFMPSGTVTITIWAIVVTLDGPWQTTVTLPAVEKTPSP